jgi:hypothetical protein
MLIEKDLNYMEGTWAGERLAPRIDKTEYETLYYAIQIKQNLIDNFEKEFGYSREMDEFDRNYSYNLGILDKLKKIYNEETNTES